MSMGGQGNCMKFAVGLVFICRGCVLVEYLVFSFQVLFNDLSGTLVRLKHLMLECLGSCPIQAIIII